MANPQRLQRYRATFVQLWREAIDGDSKAAAHHGVRLRAEMDPTTPISWYSTARQALHADPAITLETLGLTAMPWLRKLRPPRKTGG